MKKSIIINGKEYQGKRANWLGIKSGRALFQKVREATTYDNGIIVLDTAYENPKFFSTVGEGDDFSFFFYDMDGQGDEIHFADGSLEGKWQKLFLYFWEDDGEFLLYADKNVLASGGARAVVGKGWQNIWNEALTVASFLQVGLVDKILRIEAGTASKEGTIVLDGGMGNGN